MTEKDYVTGGSTALLDAVGNAICHIMNIHKYARKEDIPEHTMFVITTDGMENSSHSYDYGKVRQLIELQKEKYGWEFMFLGANIDAIDVASHLGIGESRAVNFNCDSVGTALNYEVYYAYENLHQCVLSNSHSQSYIFLMYQLLHQ